MPRVDHCLNGANYLMRANQRSIFSCLSPASRFLGANRAFCGMLGTVLAFTSTIAGAQQAAPAAVRNVRPAVSTQPIATPVLSLAPGAYPSTQTLTITDTTPGTTIYYTTNGTWPSTSSTVYSGAITISTSEVIVAMADNGSTQGGEVVAAYFIGSSPSSFTYIMAGTNMWGYSGDGGPATLALVNNASGTALDSSGNIYIADTGNGRIRKVNATTGVITTIAGNGTQTSSGDGGPAASAGFWWPTWISIDSANNIYVGESGSNVIRKIDASSGAISTIASGLGTINGMACDPAGNVYLSINAVIKKVATGTGNISTVAGTTPGYSGDGGPATSAQISNAQGLALDSHGNLYISDTGNGVIREVNAGTGNISTVVGVALGGSCKLTPTDGVLATAASLCAPAQIAFDAQNNLYIADTTDDVIREVNATSGIITTIAGLFLDPYSAAGNGDPATNVGLSSPRFLTVDAAGNVYLDDNTNTVRKITAPGPAPTMATPAPVLTPPAGTYDSAQTLSISDTAVGAAYAPSFFNGGGGVLTAPPSPANGANFYGSLNVTGSFNVNVTAVAPGYLPSAPIYGGYTITSIPTLEISTLAGGGTSQYNQPGGAATSYSLGNLQGLAIDKGGNLYVADSYYGAIYKLDTAGNFTVIASSGSQAITPEGLAVDATGNVYFTQSNINYVSMLSAQTGTITTIAGSTGGFSGDGGPATQAQFTLPTGLAFDSAGNLYIADSGNDRIRMINAKTGIITTVAGGGTSGLGDGGLATQATLNSPQGVTLDASGNMYIADQSNGRIRMVVAKTGIINTIAGDGNNGTSGNGGPAVDAEVSPYQGIAVDAQGNVYIADLDTVRRINKADGSIVNYAGNGYVSLGGDGEAPTIAGICGVQGLALDSLGNLYLSDSCNARVRKVTTVAATPVISLASGTYTSPQTTTITDSAPNATIYYTTDGSTPSTISNVYSTALNITHTQTLQAIAVSSGYAQSGVASANYTIAITPAVTVTPASSSISSGQLLSVTVAVSSTFTPAPTGTVTLASGTYTSSATTLNAGSATISIPAGALANGNDTLTASYAPDTASATMYITATGTAAIAVTPSTYSMTATGVTLSKGGSGSSTVSVSSANGYAGTVTLTCGVTSSPANATDTPTCSASQAVTLSASATSGTATVAVSSTAASARMQRDPLFKGLAGGTALAALLFFMVPRKRRVWSTLMGFVLLAGLACGLVACGGGSSSTKTTTPANPGTTSGSYTITVTGTGNDAAKTTTTTTFTLTVN